MQVIKLHILTYCAGLLAALSAASCSESVGNTPLPEETGLPLDFAPENESSRAETSTSAFNSEGSEFKVYGIYFDPTKSGYFNLFDGTTVKRTGDAWTYEPQRFWITGFTYDFHAIYPAGIDGTEVRYVKGEGADSHLSISNFTAKSTDLMVAADRRVIIDKESAKAAVALKFRHLLSRVTFTAKTDDRYLGSDGNPVRKLHIVGFKINGIAIHGNWVGDTYKTGASSTGEWTPGEQTGSYTASIPEGGIAVGNTPVRLFDGNDIIMAIPQSFEGTKVEISYKYTDEETVVHQAEGELSGTWLPGKSYSYSFTINAHIFFDTPTVDDWISAPINGSDFDIQL